MVHIVSFLCELHQVIASEQILWKTRAIVLDISLICPEGDCTLVDFFWLKSGVYQTELTRANCSGVAIMKSMKPNLKASLLSTLVAGLSVGVPAWAVDCGCQPVGQNNLWTIKDGGLAWADYNNDGCDDFAITADAGFQLYRQTRNVDASCSGDFVAVRDFDTGTRRAVAWGDYNNDGFIDIASNTSSRLVVYQNTDGTANGFNRVVDINPGDSEGLAWIDFDNDNDLDIFTQHNTLGFVIYRNTGNAINTSSTYAIPNITSVFGDYLTTADYDVDGDVDVYIRRDNAGLTVGINTQDLFENEGNGTFSAQAGPDDSADNNNKGGAAFCDLDDDGDFDIVRTSQPAGVYQQDGLYSGSFTLSSTTNIPSGADYESVACADIDNDGDLDIMFGGDELEADGISVAADENVIFRNGGDMVFSAETDKLQLDAVNPDTKGIAFSDFDRDGDIDAMRSQNINSNDALNNGATQSWVNDTQGTDYLMVNLTTGSRSAIGATAQLLTCNGTVVSGIRDVSGGTGRGSQPSQTIHFGLGSDGGAASTYIVRARFVGQSSPVDIAVRPSDIAGGYQLVNIAAEQANNTSACTGTVTDTDGDGIADINDADSDNDTIPDNLELGDSDGDGVIDALDLDSDNDGISDLVESGSPISLDANGDGRVDAENGFGTNGLVDSVETTIDSGVLNRDGTSYLINGLLDTDSDGVPNFRDLNSDGDSEGDVAESGYPINPESDDPNSRIAGFSDSDGDGWHDAVPQPFFPADSNTNGIFDYAENGVTPPAGYTVNGGLITGLDGTGSTSGSGLAYLLTLIAGIFGLIRIRLKTSRTF